MRKYLIVLLSFILTACTVAPSEVDEGITSVEPHIVQVNGKVKVSDVLLANGYVQSHNYFFRLYEESDGKFYYVFNPNNDYFTIVNAYTGVNYTTTIKETKNTYMDLILDDELEDLGLTRASFNPAIKKVETIYLGEFQLQREFKNVYQLLTAKGFENIDGYYVASYDFGKVAFNLKQKTVTVYLKDEEAYYQYNPDYDYHKYTYLDGESTYNRYDEGRSANCSGEDKLDIVNVYEDYLEPILEDMGIELYDLDVYYNFMIDKGEWSGYHTNMYDTYPNLSSDIVNIDEEIAGYVRHEFEKHGATIRDTSIEVSYKNQLAVFYFEDKTFMYGTNHVLYDWKNDVAKVGKCIYDYASDIGCSESEVQAAVETRNAYRNILDSYGLIKKELHQYANSLRLYDKTLGGDSDA